MSTLDWIANWRPSDYSDRAEVPLCTREATEVRPSSAHRFGEQTELAFVRYLERATFVTRLSLNQARSPVVQRNKMYLRRNRSSVIRRHQRGRLAVAPTRHPPKPRRILLHIREVARYTRKIHWTFHRRAPLLSTVTATSRRIALEIIHSRNKLGTAIRCALSTFIAVCNSRVPADVYGLAFFAV